MASNKIPLKFQIRLETKRGWSALTDEEQANVYTALQSALERLGVEDKERRNLFGPHWEETNVSKSLTELCWEFTLPLVIV